MRKVLAATVGAVLVGSSLVGAPLAAGHDDHSEWFRWREPEVDSDVTGDEVEVKARVEFPDGGVDRWILEVLPPDGYATLPGFGTVCEGDTTEEQERAQDGRVETVEISCEWDSTHYPDGEPSRNHAYRLRVTAWHGPPEDEQGESEGDGDNGDHEDGGEGDDDGDGDEGDGDDDGDGDEGDGDGDDGEDSPEEDGATSTSSSTSSSTTTTEPPPVQGAHESPVRTVVVANPPEAPDGVRLAYSERNGEVTVSWDPNEEPDIAGYLVQERFDSGDWSLVAKPTGTSWKGRLKEEGSYRYRVAAVRYVGSAQRLVEGPYREPQSDPRKVEADPTRDRAEAAADEDEDDDDDGDDDRDGDEDEDENGSGDDRDRRRRASSTTSTTRPPKSTIVTFGGSSDSTTSSTPGSGRGLPRPAHSAIQPGAPGSVQTRYADPAELPAPVTPEEAYDPGFSLSLPYPSDVRADTVPPPTGAPPRLLGSVVLFEDNEEQRRALVGVLAASLVAFMLAMQFAYLNRRPRPIDLAAGSDWD